MRGKYKNLSGNILLFSISSFGHKILAFILIPLYTSFLSTEQYGTIDLITTTVNLLIPLFTLNISEAVMRFTIDDQENDDYLTVGVKTILGGSCVLALVLVILYLLPILSAYKIYYGWIFVLYLVNSIYALEQNYLRATNKIPAMVTASLINSAIMLTLDVVLIAVFKQGINGYYTAMFCGLVCSLLIMGLQSKIYRHLHFRRSSRTVRGLCLAYCIPTIFTAIAWWANSGIDKYFVTGICGVDQNGIYSIAYKIPTILGIFQSIFNQAWTISAITEFDRNDTDGFFGQTYEMYNSMMILITSVIMLFNILLSRILYANEFFEAWHYVPMLLISSLFSALSGYMGSIFAAVKDTKTCAYTVVISAVINVILNAVLIPLYGVQGAAVATAVSYISAWGIRMVIARKYIRMKLQFTKDLAAYAILFIQMGFALSKTHMYAGQILLIFCLTAIYFHDYKRAFSHLTEEFKKS